MRTFVQLRRLMDSNELLAKKIESLERKYSDHDTQFAIIFEAIKALIAEDKIDEAIELIKALMAQVAAASSDFLPDEITEALAVFRAHNLLTFAHVKYLLADRSGASAIRLDRDTISGCCASSSERNTSARHAKIPAFQR